MQNTQDLLTTLGIGKLPPAAGYFILVAVALHVFAFVFWIYKLGQKRQLKDDLKFKST